MKDKQLERLKRTVRGLIVFFIFVFLSSLVPGDRVLFMLPPFVYFVLAAALNVLTLTSHPEGWLGSCFF